MSAESWNDNDSAATGGKGGSDPLRGGRRRSAPRASGGSRPGRNRSVGSRRVRGVSDLAGQIVGQAASILEEELAAGIGAAREIEDRFVDVESIRATDPNRVVQRLRKDAHDVVDIIVDLVDVAITSTGAIGGRAVAVTMRAPEDNGGAAREEAGPQVPALVIPEPVHVGES